MHRVLLGAGQVAGYLEGGAEEVSAACSTAGLGARLGLQRNGEEGNGGRDDGSDIHVVVFVVRCGGKAGFSKYQISWVLICEKSQVSLLRKKKSNIGAFSQMFCSM